MTAVNLETAKLFMKIDGSAEDQLILMFIDAAEASIENYIGKPLADLQPIRGDLQRAILLLVSFYFEHRNIASFGLSVEMTPGMVTSILDSYREKWFTDGE